MQRGIPIFIDMPKLDECTGTRVFCMDLVLELHFKSNDDCGVFQAEIFATFRAIEEKLHSLG